MLRSSRRGFTQIDLYVSIVLGILLLAYFFQASPHMHRGVWRVKCSSNLRQIGQAMMLYADENNGNYPRTTYDPADPTVRAYTGVAAPKPFGAGGPKPNDVTAAFFLLLRTQNISSGTFICPSTTRTEPFDFGGNGQTSQDYSNFPSEKNLSYSITNPYPSPAAVKHGYRWTNTLKSDFAIAADMNPGSPELWSLTTNDGQSKQRAGNTRNHNGGQSVLYGDLHVDFASSSFAGVNLDNIYGPGGLLNAGSSNETIDPLLTGTSFYASPMHKDDSVLLPVATVDPGGLVEPSAFQVWWRSDTPRRLTRWILAMLVSGWVAVRCVWPAIRLLAAALRNQIPERRRIRQGLCPKCGYDLRASPERCPECGQIRQRATEVS